MVSPAQVALSVSNSKLFDVKCLECDIRDDVKEPCSEFTFDAKTRKALKNEKKIKGKYIPKEDFGRYRYQLNLPGSVSGSYSRNLNHLWLVGSVVAMWNAPSVARVCESNRTAAAPWTFRGDESRHRRGRGRGYSVETSRGDAAAKDADIPSRQVAATPRPRTRTFRRDESRRRRGQGRGHSVETSRDTAAAGDVDIPRRRASRRRFVEHYYPALKEGETHVAFDRETAAAALAAVTPELRDKLVQNARKVADELLCPDCLANYWRLVVAKLRE